MRKLILRNSLWQVFEQGAKLVSGVVVSALIARQLGPELFGWLSYATNVVALVLPLAGLAMGEVVTREIVRRKEEQASSIIRTALLLRLFAGLLCVGGVAGWLWFNGKNAADTRGLLLLIASSVLIFQAPTVAGSYFQANLKMGFIVRLRLLALVFGIIIKVGLLIGGAGVVWYGVAASADVLWAGLISLVALERAGGLRDRGAVEARLDWGIGRLLTRAASPLIVSGILIAAFFRVEQFIVEHVLGGVSYGVYMAAVRIGGISNLFIPPMLGSLLPVLLKRDIGAADSGGSARAAAFASVLRVLLPASVLAGAGLGIGGAIASRFLLGPAYVDAAWPIVILACAVPANVSGALRAHFFLSRNLMHLHIPAAVVGIICSAGLAWLLCPRFGLIGAALATTLSTYVSAIGTSFLQSATRDFGRDQLFAMGAFAHCFSYLRGLRYPRHTQTRLA